MKTTNAWLVVVLVVSLVGCSAGNVREVTGAGLGAVAGGVLGNQIGDGTGKEIATAVGAVAGATAGAAIGRHLDDAARAEAQRATVRALDTAPVGGTGIAWESPASSATPASGTVHVTRQGRSQAGELCREYRQSVTIGDATEEVIGTACRGTGGVWRIVEG